MLGGISICNTAQTANGNMGETGLIRAKQSGIKTKLQPQEEI